MKFAGLQHLVVFLIISQCFSNGWASVAEETAKHGLSDQEEAEILAESRLQSEMSDLRQLENLLDDYEAEVDTLEADKRSPYAFGIGKRGKSQQAYGFGLGKRSNPYAFGLGKRVLSHLQLGKKGDPIYAFGLGKRNPYAFGLGKRGEYSFGLGKRTPYTFGLGRKRDPYAFGLGK